MQKQHFRLCLAFVTFADLSNLSQPHGLLGTLQTTLFVAAPRCPGSYPPQIQEFPSASLATRAKGSLTGAQADWSSNRLLTLSRSYKY